MPLTAAITGFDVGAGIVEHEWCRPRTHDALARPCLPTHRFRTVDACAKRLVARTRQHDNAHRIVAPQHAPQLVQLALHLHVERIVHVGTIERHPRDPVLFLVEQRLILGHVSFSLGYTSKCTGKRFGERNAKPTTRHSWD
jgi:hypothetical protein